MINLAFEIVRENLIFSSYYEELAFRYTIEHFIDTPILMPDGELWLAKTGVPSGSYFTQIIDSIINHIVITFCQLKTYGRHFNTYVLGDDSLFGVPYDLGYPRISEFAEHAKTLNFTLHPDKTIIATRPDELDFLGHTARALRCDRDTITMLKLALFPEETVPSPDVSLSRVRGLTLDSAMNNWPLLHLYEYMTSKYRGVVSHAPTTTHWLQNAINWTFHPATVDFIKLLTLT